MLPKINDKIQIWQWRGDTPGYFEAIATSEPYLFDETDEIYAINYSFENIEHYAILGAAYSPDERWEDGEY